MAFERKKINKKDIDDEKKVLTAMITDKTFLEIESVEPDFFSVDYMNVVSSWCRKFYEKYKEAPGRHVEDIYEKTSYEREEADNDLIEIFLESIANEYARSEKRNTAYIIDLKKNLQTKKEFEIHMLQASAFGKEGNFDEAYNVFNTKISGDSNRTRSFNPFELEEVDRYFALKENLSIMDLNGDLKTFFDRFERGWVVSFLAPEKGGKSFLLEEINFIGNMNNLNTAVFSIELNETHYKKRKYERITTTSDSFEGVQELPVIDCVLNQTNKCTKPIRSCRVPLGFEDEEKIITDNSEYKRCIACKGKKDFKPTTVMSEVYVEKMTKKKLKSSLKAFNSMYHGRTEVTCYPTFSASMDDIESRITYLENTHNIVFDAVFIDYPDITLSDKVGRDVYDDIWKKAKRIATEKNVCVFVVEQGNKETNFKEMVDQTNTSEDKRKNAHVDAKYAINMTKPEAIRKTARLSCLFHRHMDVDLSKHLLCCRYHVFANPFGETAIVKMEVK